MSIKNKKNECQRLYLNLVEGDIDYNEAPTMYLEELKRTKECDKFFGSLKKVRDLHRNEMTNEIYESVLSLNNCSTERFAAATQVIGRLRTVTRDEVFPLLTFKNKLTYYYNKFFNFWG